VSDMSSKILLLSFICLLGYSSVKSQEDWRELKDKNGIKVFTRKTPNSKFHELKIECEFEGRISQLAAVLLDVNNHPRWSYNTVSTRILKASATDVIFYVELECPWPIENRDVVVHTTLSQNFENKVMTINSKNVDDYLPVEESIVRVKYSKVSWIVTPLNDSRFNVEYRLQMDPGGSIPAWLLNLFISKGPFESFTKLKEQIQLPEYREAKFTFLQD
jgi:START domain